MRRGEITGQFFNTSNEDFGMPFRSTYLTKKNERRNISTMDDIFNDKQESTKSFDYYDPSMTTYACGTSENSMNKKPIDDPRLLMDIEHVQNKTHNNMNRYVNIDTYIRTPKLRQPTNIDRFTDGSLQNINTSNTDYINTMSFNIFNEIADKTYVNFCVFPIGIMSSLVENDPNIKKIISLINTNEIFYQLKINNMEKTIISRTSIIPHINTSDVTNTFTHYKDNDNHIIEIPMADMKFAVGFVSNKHGNNVQINQKLFYEYVLNLKHSKTNVYCPSFKITNKLGLNNTLSKLGYINNNNVIYSQTILFNFQNNLYIKKSSVTEQVDLTNNFIFYVRFVPNNILLYIGRCGDM